MAAPTAAWSPPKTSSCTRTTAAAPSAPATGTRSTPAGGPDVQVQPRDFRHQQRLRGLGGQAGRGQPPGQIGGLIVGVVLPLPRTAQIGEPANLGRDHGVGAGRVKAGEIGPQHTAPAIPGGNDPGEVFVPLDPGPRLGSWVTAQLIVELRQHGSTVHRDIPAPDTSAGQLNDRARPATGHGVVVILLPYANVPGVWRRRAGPRAGPRYRVRRGVGWVGFICGRSNTWCLIAGSDCRGLAHGGAAIGPGLLHHLAQDGGVRGRGGRGNHRLGADQPG